MNSKQKRESMERLKPSIIWLWEAFFIKLTHNNNNKIYEILKKDDKRDILKEWLEKTISPRFEINIGKRKEIPIPHEILCHLWKESTPSLDTVEKVYKEYIWYI